MKSQIVQQLDEFIIKFSRTNSPFDLDEETDLILNLGYDSIVLIQLIVTIENHFKIEFEDYYLNPKLIYRYQYLKDYVLKLLAN